MISKKIKKIILFSLLLIAIVFVVHIIRNYIIISDIIQKQEKLNQNNFSYINEQYARDHEDDKAVIRVYYKDGKSLLVVGNENNNGNIWYDKNTNEEIFWLPTQLKAFVQHRPESLIMPTTFNAQTLSMWDKLQKAIFSLISEETVNGQVCYVIQNGGVISYTTKAEGIMIKLINGTVTIDENKYESISEYKNWEFNNLTDDDVKQPDLTGYEIINQ